jgi:hypothetical protein
MLNYILTFYVQGTVADTGSACRGRHLLDGFIVLPGAQPVDFERLSIEIA